MKVLAVPLLALGLAACAGPHLPPVNVSIAGPKFAPARFGCGRSHPAPPNPDVIAADQVDRAAANYETNLDAWGRSCRDRLRSLGAELKAAGQVVSAPAKGK